MNTKGKVVLTPQYVNEYFSHLNPIALKISNDIVDTKLSYGSFWRTLNYAEQNDIINETLIKPEISLRYFYNVCRTATSSIASIDQYDSDTKLLNNKLKLNNNTKRHSTEDNESLTAIVFKDLCNTLSTDVHLNSDNNDKSREGKSLSKPITLITHVNEKLKLLNNKHCNCAFDGRTLRTYTIQDVALKVIYEDLGTYRDEHSQPFSYRTKSQINFQLFEKDTPTDKTELSLKPYDGTKQIKNSKKCTNNMYMQSNNLSRMFQNNSEDKCIYSATSYYEDDDSIALLTDNKNISDCTDYYGQLSNCILNSEFKQKTENSFEQVKNIIVNTDSSKKNSFANYKVSLIKTKVSPIIIEQCYNERVLDATGNNSTSNDIQQKDDLNYAINDQEEKYLSEETKLLEKDEITLKRGFDFLNNW